MSEAWAITIFGSVTTILMLVVAWLANKIQEHNRDCKKQHELLATLVSDVRGIKDEIGTRRTGMRGEIHGHSATLLYQGGNLWLIARSLGVELPPPPGKKMTPDELRAAMPHAGTRAETFAEPLTSAMVEFSIMTAPRQAAFIAQLAHESGSLFYMEELADGSAYEGRTDLGNTQTGDGKFFKGHGPIQITGRANHLACGKALGLDLIADPRLLTQPGPGCRSAGWFWMTRGCNGLADVDRFGTICHVVNGGYRGLDERISHWLVARRALGL